MVTFKLTQRLSEGLYSWVLNTKESLNDVNMYMRIFSNDSPDLMKTGHGMEYCFMFLIIVSFVVAIVYYRGIAKKVQSATKKNYMMTYLMGFISLVAINYVGMALILEGKVNVLLSFNMLKICLIDVVYYTVLFQIWSWMFKHKSKASNIDLWSIVKENF